MNIYIILAVITAFIFLILYRFKITVNAFIDLTRLESAFSLKISLFKAFEGKLKVKKFQLYLCTNKCEEIPIDVAAIISGEKYTDILISNIFLNLNIKELYLFVSSCVKNDQYYNIMLSALINILNKAAKAVLTTKTGINYRCDVTAEYERNMLEVTLNCIIRKSIADIIYVAVKSLFDRLRKAKKEKKNA